MFPTTSLLFFPYLGGMFDCVVFFAWLLIFLLQQWTSTQMVTLASHRWANLLSMHPLPPPFAVPAWVSSAGWSGAPTSCGTCWGVRPNYPTSPPPPCQWPLAHLAEDGLRCASDPHFGPPLPLPSRPRSTPEAGRGGHVTFKVDGDASRFSTLYEPLLFPAARRPTNPSAAPPAVGPCYLGHVLPPINPIWDESGCERLNDLEPHGPNTQPRHILQLRNYHVPCQFEPSALCFFLMS